MPFFKSKKPERRYILPAGISFLFQTYFLSLIFFFTFRAILAITNFEKLILIPKSIWIYSFLYVGIRFDNVLISQILALPFLLFTIAYLAKWKTINLLKGTTIYISIFFMLAFGLCAADIPYFNYTNSRITINIFSWVDDLPTMFKAMVSSTEYILSILLFFLTCFLFNFIIWKWYRIEKKRNTKPQSMPLFRRILVSFVLLFLLIFGLRGRFQLNSHPLVIRDAFSSNYTLVDQITLNGAHHFLSSLQDEHISFMDNQEAIRNAQKYLSADSVPKNSISRKIIFDQPEQKSNVIIVLMESMSSEKVGWYNPGKQSLTSNLDSLIKNSLFFPNTYSAGIMTSNGIFSTLFSLPTFKDIKPTLSSSFAGASLAGIPNILKTKGYQNLYFCNGTLEFNNVNTFLKQNNFDLLKGSESIDKEKIISIWGVSDLSLFNHSMHYLDSVSTRLKPFLAVYNTISTHPPHVIPTNEAFKPTAKSKIDQSYEYSDWAIGQFLKASKEKEWYNNTLFVFIADHGRNFNVTYEMPLSYNHIPLIFYYPGKIVAKTDKRLALQMDVFPTIMSILNMPFTNNTMGIDLLTQKRPYAYFQSNNKFGCINEDYFLIYKYKQTYLYDYKLKSTINIANEHKEVVDDMKKYMFSMIQTTNYMLNNGLSGVMKE